MFNDITDTLNGFVKICTQVEMRKKVLHALTPKCEKRVTQLKRQIIYLLENLVRNLMAYKINLLEKENELKKKSIAFKEVNNMGKFNNEENVILMAQFLDISKES